MDFRIYFAIVLFVVMYLIMLAVVYVIAAIPQWKIMEKMGEPGWKGIIPVYNVYMFYKKTWKPAMFFVYLGLALVYIVLFSIALTIIAVALFTERTDLIFFAIILFFVSYAVIIASLVIQIIFYHKISKAFGHGAGFTVGLVLLNMIFLYILAFSSSQYVLGQKEGFVETTAEAIEE